MRIVAGALLALAATIADGATFHEQVLALYDFSPHTLNSEQIEAKSKLLDAFWSEQERRGEAGIQDLRLELKRSDIPSFFGYDGAKLLLSLSKTRADRALALKGIERADLRDIQWNDYFLTVHWLAVEGHDTTEAAFKILGDKTFEVFIPQHYLTLNQEMCLLYLLMPTDQKFYLAKTEERLFDEKDVTAQKSLLGLLANTATKIGDDALARFAADLRNPAESREQAQTILEAINGMSAMPVIGFSLSSYESLKADQRKLFGRVSDEALSEWHLLRIRLRSKGPQ